MTRSQPFTFILAGLLAILPCGLARGAPASGALPDMASQLDMLPALRSAALDHGIRLDGFDPIEPVGKLRAGDSVTAVFTTFKGKRFKQWVVELMVLAPSDGNRGVTEDAVMYTATGHRMQFRSGIAEMTVRIVGPMADGAEGSTECPEKTVATTAHQDFLRMGAYGLCRVVTRFTDRGEEPRVGYSTVPFSPADIEKGKAIAKANHVTREDELAFAGGAEALNEFTRNASEIPGILGIASQGIDWPSIWTMLREMNFNIWSVIDWKGTVLVDQGFNGDSMRVYHLPFDLYMFGSHISRGGWFITTPDSPLTVCGGVVGVWLQSVDHPESRMVMRVIAAHRGT
jgi:hypothetical protein